MEVWRKIDEAPNYEVSNLGNVRNSKIKRNFRASPNTSGYPKVGLRVDGRSITRSVHGLVARAFIEGFREFLEPNHIDGNKFNNAVENLEWSTHRSNMFHAIATGLFTPSGGRPKRAVRILETGEVFESLSSCARAISGKRGCIVQCIEGRQKSHKGYTFEYV